MDNPMYFERSLSISASQQQISHDKRQRQARDPSQLSSCQICGDKAYIINYGALACQSCKTFFRRNGFHPKKVHPCLFNNLCEMNTRSRRRCTACRLAKCFSVGMNSDLIRKEERRNEKYSPKSKYTTNKGTVRNQIEFATHLCTSDRPLLVSYEQKICSNVIHVLEIYSAIPNVRDIVEFGLNFNITNAMEVIILIYTSMRSFINSTPDFQVLTINEQYSLLKRNLNGVVSLYSAVVFRDAGILNSTRCIKIFASIYGSDMIIQSIRINTQLEPNLIIIKFMLLILAFSPNCFIVDFEENDSLLLGTHRLLGSQNMYVEILWKYLTSQYSYYEAAFRFSRLITVFLDLNKIWTNAYINNTIHHDLINDFNIKTKQLLMINQNKPVSLWGMI